MSGQDKRLIEQSCEVDAPAEAVFAVLVDPRRHHEFDGSGTVRSRVSGPARLSLDARFGMSMRMGLPYRITNTVVEFEADRLIAWTHPSRVRWRYRIEPLSAERCRVTESWDARRSPFWPALRALGVPGFAQRAIQQTLPRLAAVAAGGPTVGS